MTKMADSETGIEVMDVDKEVITIYDDDDMAEAKKDEGNKLYQLKQYKEALHYYNEAVNLQPDNVSYYGNRSACYIMLGRFKEALEDAKKSVSLDPKFVKGYIRMAKSYIVFGDIAAARSSILKAKELCPNSKAADDELRNIEAIKKFKEDADKAYELKDYRRVVYCIDQIQRLGVNCSSYKLFKAECLAFLGRIDEAQVLASNVLQFDKQNPDAIYIRGLCIYYEGDASSTEKAFTHFQHALKLAPDHKKLLEMYKKARLLKQKKEEGNKAFKASKFQEAYNLYTEALSVDPNNKLTNAKLYFNRATVSSKLGKLNNAVADCNAALKLDEKYLKALLRRAWCYMELENYKEAVRDYEQIYKMDRTRGNEKLLRAAKLELKKSSRKDYYKILGITKTATAEEIKKAYRKRALVHHPDRHSNASEPERLEQEKKFKEVGEAYGILSDPKKRARYDNGQDLEDMEEINPNGVFYSFFGGYPSSDTFSFSSYDCPDFGVKFQFI